MAQAPAEPGAPALAAASAETALLIQIENPAALLDNPFLARLAGILGESPGLQRALQSDEVKKLRGAARFLEKAQATDWKNALAQLTAGGILIAVENPVGHAAPGVLVVVTSDEKATLARFAGAVLRELEAQANAPRDPKQPATQRPRPPPRAYRGFTCYEAGDGHFAVAENRLVASNQPALLEAALDRLAGLGNDSSFEIPSPLRPAAEQARRPRVQVTANLRRLLREPPRSPPQLPADDPLAVALLGGYIDVLAKAEYGAAALEFDETGVEFRVTLSAGASNRFAGIEGFFAASPALGSAPLLMPRGTLLSLAWYRDYHALWRQRGQLLRPEAALALERQLDQRRRSPDQVDFAGMLQSLGQHPRLVVTRPQGPHLADRALPLLPAAALVIDLRDEPLFRKSVLAPVDRLAWALALATAGDVTSDEYQGTRLTTLQFGQAALAQAADALLSINPSYAVHRGHAIAGSTDQVVRAAIDELDRQALGGKNPRIDASTARLHLNLRELAGALELFSSQLAQRDGGSDTVSAEQTEEETKVIVALLRQLELVESRDDLTPELYRFQARIGPAAGAVQAR